MFGISRTSRNVLRLDAIASREKSAPPRLDALSTIRSKDHPLPAPFAHLAQQQNGLLQFVLQHAGLHQLQRPAVDAEISTAALAVGDRGCAFLQRENPR